VQRHAPLALLGHAHCRAPVRERHRDAHHLAHAPALHVAHQQVLGLEVPPQHPRFLQLLQPGGNL